MSTPGRILIVDDRIAMAEAIGRALEKADHDVTLCNSAEEALAAFGDEKADVVVTDQKMPGMDGVALMRALHRSEPRLPVILVTAHGNIPSAVAAMREGAFDYVAKPFDNDELRAVVQRAVDLRRLGRENRDLRRTLIGRHEMIAESSAMRDVLDLVDRAAVSEAPVLIEGQSGTGKELVARRLHAASPRVTAPFVAVNCKAFAEELLESELFGHEKGSFTGAATARAGCFERADGGTLFLDEIGEVSEAFQAKILRVLQEREVLRVGADSARPFDARIITATNRDLRQEVEAGRFRQDLYFRLAVVPVHLPALRERREDILPLAHHFLARLSEQDGRTLTFAAEVEVALRAHDWPGNVRELQNVITRACVLTRHDVVDVEDLILEQSGSRRTAPGSDETLQARLDGTTRAAIEEALERTDKRKAEAAARLGIDRTTLYRLMKRLGLDG